MCLKVTVAYLGNEIPYYTKAKSAIHCYKVIRKDKRGNYRTPCQNAKISWFQIHGLTRFKAKGNLDRALKLNTIPEGDFLRVYDGVIHTLEKLPDAIDCVDRIQRGLRVHSLEIWECIVPRGVEFMVGVDDHGRSCIGSRSIRFIRKIDATLSEI